MKLTSSRLLFPNGAERDVTLVPGRSTTARFTVETRSSGNAPVTMTVTAANGALTVTPGVLITVKSSFVSGVGLVLTIGAAAFLLLWWAWDIHRRRRRRVPARPRAHRSRRSTRVTASQPEASSGGHRRSLPHQAMVRSSAVVAVGTALSRVTGFARIAAIAYALGATALAGTYSYANEAPNIVFELLLGGVFTATLVPLFIRHVDTRDDDSAAAVFTIAILVLTGATLIGVIAAPWIVPCTR